MFLTAMSAFLQITTEQINKCMQHYQTELVLLPGLDLGPDQKHPNRK
jgi:hypothetical protein